MKTRLTFAFIAVTALLGLSFALTHVIKTERYLGRLTQEIRRLEPEAKTVDRLAAELAGKRRVLAALESAELSDGSLENLVPTQGRARSGAAKTASRTSLEDLSSSRRGGLRSGTNRPKGRTKEQLYAEAQRLNLPGGSRMNKVQLQRAVDRRRS